MHKYWLRFWGGTGRRASGTWADRPCAAFPVVAPNGDFTREALGPLALRRVDARFPVLMATEGV